MMMQQQHATTPPTTAESITNTKIDDHIQRLHASSYSRRSFLVRASAATLLIATSSIMTPPSVYAASSTSTSIPRPRQQALNLPFPKFQFDTVADVPKSYFDQERSIYALVERVIDGDTIRVRHVPLYGFTGQSPSPLTSRGIADQTMSIRVYGVDCPEIAKNGKAGQPFAEEAKQFTSKLLLHKMVKITFLRRDQYGRAVSAIETVTPWWKMGLGKKDLSMELARQGLAELYTGGGAEYFVSICHQQNVRDSLSFDRYMARADFFACVFSSFIVLGQASCFRKDDCASTVEEGRHLVAGQETNECD
jgi:endonuclease YncB( thermonuclease family)